MKTNLPVTQREIDYPEDKVFITKTDTKGAITYANDAFVEISGYSSGELVGQNHNIVRHPDMPAWVFNSLWNVLHRARPWRGIVKNRAKNGDHYWVRATISPIVDNGTIVGYISLRKKPARNEITAAEALYKSGVVPSEKLSLFKRFQNLTLGTKLQLLIQPALLIMLSIGSFAVVKDNRSSMFYSAQQHAEQVANEVIDSANMLMVTGQISDVETRKLLIKKLSGSGNIVGLRLMRTDAVAKTFGPGLPEEQIQGELQRRAITSDKPYFAIEQINGKPIFHSVMPYIATHSYHGTDCMTCHLVAEGTVLGVSDIQIDLSGEYDRLNSAIMEQIFIQIAFQLIMFFFIRLVVHRFVVKPVDEIKLHLSEVINGKMTGMVDISGYDEMGQMLCSVQSTKVLLGSIIDQITTVSGHIDDRAKHLSVAMTKVADSSQTQSDAANTMASSVEQMTVSIDQIAENAGDVRRISETSASLANEGGMIVQKVVADMSMTNQSVMKTAETMHELGDQSDRIQDVVKVIKEIADQTNLLALNAAIEAARAGEQGRGFAVVADEVRKLAEKTGRSTQEIAVMVDKIRGSTSHAMEEMVATVEMVKEGSVMAEKAGSSIVQINDGVSRALKGVEDISSSIRAQSVASREISDNVEKVASMSEMNRDAVRDVFSTVESLETLSNALEQSVRHFRI
jgi:PAS domain S-box-containing protein